LVNKYKKGGITMNKVTLLGRLTKEPELKFTGNNVAVATYGLAVNRRFNKPGEEKQADFLNIVAWNKLAEFCGNYFKKGMQVVIVGRIQTRTWDDDSGKRNYMTEIVAEEAYFADSKKDSYGDSKKTVNEDSEQVAVEEDDELPF
jgi:single-strand DNA-binding protein